MFKRIILKATQIKYVRNIFKAYGIPHNVNDYIRDFIVDNYELYRFILDEIYKVNVVFSEKTKLLHYFNQNFYLTQSIKSTIKENELVLIDERLTHRLTSIWGRTSTFILEKEKTDTYITDSITRCCNYS